MWEAFLCDQEIWLSYALLALSSTIRMAMRQNRRREENIPSIQRRSHSLRLYKWKHLVFYGLHGMMCTYDLPNWLAVLSTSAQPWNSSEQGRRALERTLPSQNCSGWKRHLKSLRPTINLRCQVHHFNHVPKHHERMSSVHPGVATQSPPRAACSKVWWDLPLSTSFWPYSKSDTKLHLEKLLLLSYTSYTSKAFTAMT